MPARGSSFDSPDCSWCDVLSIRCREGPGEVLLELLLPAVLEPGALGVRGIAPTVVAHPQARAGGIGEELEQHLGVAERARPAAAQQPRFVDLEHLTADRPDLGGAGLERERA